MSETETGATVPNRPTSPLFKADTAALHLKAEKNGTVRVTYAGWDDAKVLLAGEALVVRWKEGQVHLYRTPPGPPIDYRDLLKRYMQDVVSLGGGGAYLLNDGLTLSGPDLAELQEIEREVKADPAVAREMRVR